MEPAPFFADLADGPPGGAAHRVRAEDGVRLRVGHWPGAGRGTVLLFPGRTEYVEKYGITARAFAEAGVSTMVVDWRGQGLSDRLIADHALGHVDDFAAYQRDVAAMTDAARALALPEPHYLLAHSMGGAIGLDALARGLSVRAAAFSAPMWGLALPPALDAPSRRIARLARAAGLGAQPVPGNSGRDPYIASQPFERNPLTHDPDMWRRLVDQLRSRPELAVGAPTLGWLAAAFDALDRLARLPSPGVAALTLLGGTDRVVDTGVIRGRMRHWPGGHILELDAAAHEPLMERPDVRRRAEAAILDHYAAAGGAAARTGAATLP